ncbi:phosphatase PAP2 family protein [Labilibaculum sp. A4]|uniref:phosphatase PAP2 family protein n=1 Tax=Labilibaculum euxinus TaxID=2686357 RepID=UPI000F6247DC|nr:phosphatase PAP2 family protein [Labilibaculum euxinus]MDQ1769330.1 phosphatase PAP2 family protein [Labilibaculum euxinus]MWN74855.1 phosphatase PAP2 family protein [Labilibaculum euxinus]
MRFYFLFLQFLLPPYLFANYQVSDTLTKEYKYEYEHNLNLKNTAFPLGLLTLGFFGIESDGIQFVNKKIRNGVTRSNDKHLNVDDFLRHAPGVAVYVNNLLGIKGNNNLKNQLLIHATSLLIMSQSVSVLKKETHVKRPDGGSYTSFPSSHTALAFANAEFLWQEYKDVSIWYGIAGYTLASSVGVLRIWNDKHWTTDVLAGAAVGILSTKLAYFVHEKVSIKLNKKNKSVVIFPHYNTKQLGLSCSITL